MENRRLFIMAATPDSKCVSGNPGANGTIRNARTQIRNINNSDFVLGATEGKRGKFGEVPNGSERYKEFDPEWADRPIREWHFPPGRTDRSSWERVAELEPSKMPAIESEIRGMAYGMASRADQLRTIGNGVEPLAAAYAFLTLLACAEGVNNDRI
jgi:hypothetical protein